jgi:RNA polymerase sigma-70 factor, ECF subfamily
MAPGSVKICFDKSTKIKIGRRLIRCEEIVFLYLDFAEPLQDVKNLAMDEDTSKTVGEWVDNLYRTESRRVFATLIRLLGDFDLAEEALHEAFAAAVEQWTREGVPKNPRAWLVSTGRFKAIDALRRRTRFSNSLAELVKDPERDDLLDVMDDVEDDRLRLIFTCCHPALAPSTQVALTLREICGLKTEEIASAFLSAPSTIAQRIVRGKAKIRDAGIPYVVPAIADLPERLDAVLSVIYLVFNEGYSASSGESVTRADLSGEAIRLGRLLVDLLPDPEAMGLLALMLLQESRRTARTSSTGDLILLEDQDRSLWNREQITEGKALVERALSNRQVGVYAIQAAIAAVHTEASSAEETDWAQIVALYDLLAQATPSPVIELNRAVAVAMRDGPLRGLQLVDNILAQGDLSDYHLAHAARADLCRRLGKMADARASYQQALAIARQEPERRFLEKRLAELD